MSDWEVKSVSKIGDAISVILEPKPDAGAAAAFVGFILGMGLMHIFGVQGWVGGLLMWVLGTAIASFFFWPAVIIAVLSLMSFLA